MSNDPFELTHSAFFLLASSNEFVFSMNCIISSVCEITSSENFVMFPMTPLDSLVMAPRIVSIVSFRNLLISSRIWETWAGYT